MKKTILKRTLSIMLSGVLGFGMLQGISTQVVYGNDMITDETGNILTELDIDIKHPIVGEYMYTKGEINSYLGDYFGQLGELKWYKDGVKVDNPTNAKFEKGANYSVVICLQTNNKPADRFSDDIVAKINDCNVEVKKCGNYDNQYVVELAYDFYEAYETIKEVHISGVDRPKIGDKPDYNAKSLETDLYDIQQDEGRDVRWCVDGKQMSEDDVFEEGKTYSASINLAVNDGYRFNASNEWGIEMEGYLNGNNAVVTGTLGELKDVVNVTYFFRNLDTEGIETVTVKGTKPPVPGKTPDYKWPYTEGCAYYIPKISENEYQKNGITWVDVTDSENEVYLRPTDKFVVGHTYKMIIDVVAEEGHRFIPDDGVTEKTEYGIEWNVAEEVEFDGASDTHKKIAFESICIEKNINSFEVYDLELPFAGKTPDYSANVGESEYYKLDDNFGINGVEWSNIGGTVMNEGDKFVDGEIYNVKVKIIPTTEEGKNKSKFYFYSSCLVNYGYGEVEVSETGEYAYLNRTFISVQNEEPLSVTLNNYEEKKEYAEGEKITLQANAIGGSGEYTFKYAVLNVATGKWTVLKDFSDDLTCDYTFKNAGAYQFALSVKDSEGNKESAQRLSVNVKEDSNKLSAILKGNGATEKLVTEKGEPLKLSVEANGGSGEYTYKFAVLNIDTGKWSVLKDFSETNTYTYVLNYPGKKQFAVTVKDSKGNTVATNRITVDVYKKMSAKLTVAGSTENLVKDKGSNIILTPVVTGGTNGYTYKYAVLNVDTGKWSVLKDFSSSSTYTYVLKYPGTKQFAVTVKDSKGNTVATNRLTVVVKN